MRILMIANNPLWPLRHGGSQRTSHLWRALRDLGDVSLVLLERFETLTDEQVAWHQQNAAMAARVRPRRRGAGGGWRWVRPLLPGKVDQIAHVLGHKGFYFAPDPMASRVVEGLLAREHFDVVVCRYLQTAALAGVLGKHPLLVDVDDLDTHAAESQWAAATHPLHRLILRRHLRQLQRLVPAALTQVDHAWVSSTADVQAVAAMGVPASVLPNLPPSPPLSQMPDEPAARVVLMVGSMGFRPNHEGLFRMVREIWPRVRHAVPAAVLRVVGAGLAESQRRQLSCVPGVELLGAVDDVAPAYAAAQLAVVPVWFGGGTKIKVLEALAYGRPCVLTPAAHRGYEHTLPAGEAVLVGPTPADLAEGIVMLLNDKAQRQALARGGWEAVRQHYGWHAFAHRVHEDLGRVVQQQPKEAKKT